MRMPRCGVRRGGLFAANPMTGSVGVVTINLPRIAYEASDKADFFARLRQIMELSKTSLEMKRKHVEELTDRSAKPQEIDSKAVEAGVPLEMFLSQTKVLKLSPISQ